jgi:hypothetical protein
MYDRRSSSDEVNADLWRDNRRRWKISTMLLALSLLVAAIFPKFPHSGVLGKILFAVFMISYVGGMLGLHWARGESAFLSKPDPPEPRQLWKFRE